MNLNKRGMNLKVIAWFLAMYGVGVCFADVVETSDRRQSYMAQYSKSHYPPGMGADFWYDFETVFFDLDADGTEEALIACKLSRDRSGNGWAITRRNATTGKI